MVLYGYDASVFNAAQGSDNWLEWFDLDTVSTPAPKGLLYTSTIELTRLDWKKRDANLIGLINTSYTIGAIVAGWFLGGPTVSVQMFIGMLYIS